MDSLYAFFKNMILAASSWYMIVFLSMHRHNVSPAFTTAVFPNCPCRLSSCFFFARTRVHLRNTIVYGNIKIYRSNVKNIVFSQKVVFRICYSFCYVAWEPSNRSLPFFFCRTFTHWYTDFWSYLDFHKMHDVPGFSLSRSHIHMCAKLKKLCDMVVQGNGV